MLSERVGRLPGLYELPSRLAAACAVGLVLALLTLAVGPITLPIVFFGLFVLPWLMQDVFRLFIWLIVTWPLLTLFVRLPLPAGIPDISYDRVLVLLLLGIIILEAVLSKRRLAKGTALDILALAYVVTQLSSRVYVLWFGGMGSPNLNGLLDIVFVPLVMYWVTKNLLVSRTHLKWLLYALVIACLLICLSGLYEQAVGAEERLFTVSTGLGGREELQKRGWMDVPGGRAAGVLGNPAVYGATLGIGILAGLGCVAHANQKRTQAALVATIMILLYGVFASYTRSAWISVAVVLFLAQFSMGGIWKKTLPIFMAGVLLLFLIEGSLLGNPTVWRRALDMETVTVRLALARLGWDRFLERPLLGWGAGALDAFGMERIGQPSHNIFETLLVDGGLVLFLSFSAAVGYLLIRAIRVYGMIDKNSLERQALVAATGSILIFLLSGMALELRYFGYFNALFWICAGILDRLGPKYGHEGETSIR